MDDRGIGRIARTPLKIAHVRAIPLRVRVPIAGQGTSARTLCYVEVETTDGIVGHGATGHAEPEPVAALVNHAGAALLKGADPMAHERVWETLHRAFAGRGQTGIAWHAISAIDLALWDIKGKAFGLPLWRLLGGAREKLPLYATFGLPSFDRDRLAAEAKQFVADGFTAVKMVVGIHARRAAATSNNLGAALAEDAARVRAVRAALGDGVDIYLSAQSLLTLPQALHLARLIADCNIALFQEPVAGNDPRELAAFRHATGIPTTLGQSAGSLERFRDYFMHRAIDYVQPNVVTAGGYTGALRVAALARAFGVPLFNGGSWLHHNMHLMAGLANGTLGEWFPFWGLAANQAIFKGLPLAERGWLTMPEKPGLGFDPDPDGLKEWAIG